jgi:hypothetical protein
MKDEENVRDITKMIKDPTFTSFVAKYLRDLEQDINKTAEMRTKFGATWKDMIRTGEKLIISSNEF